MDIKVAIEKLLSLYDTYSRVASIFVFIGIVLWIWAVSATLSVDLPMAGGTKFNNLNVGHALVLGPFIILLSSLWGYGILDRISRLRRVLREEFEASKNETPQWVYMLETGCQRPTNLEKATIWEWVNIGFKVFWFFSIPVLSYCAVFYRFLDLQPLPNNKCNMTKGMFWSFYTYYAGRPCLPDSQLPDKIQTQLPHIYVPLLPWLYVFGLIVLILIMYRSFRVWLDLEK